MKKIHLLMLLPALILILGCEQNNSSTANESVTEPLPRLMPEMEFSGTEAKAIGYIKTIALPKLIQKAVSVAQAVKPGPQVAMLPAMAGLALGDPALTSVDQEAPVTALVFDDFRRQANHLPSFVLVMKLSPESPVIKQAENMNMQTMEVDGWTLATMNPQLFKEVEDWSSLLSFAKESPEEDIEMVISMKWALASLGFLSTALVEKNPIVYVGWTLEWEMLFYLVFGLSLWFRSWTVTFFTTCVALVGVAFIASNFILVEFIAGLYIALLYKRYGYQRYGMFSLVLGTILLSLSLFDSVKLLIDSRVILWGLPGIFIVYGVICSPQIESKIGKL